MLLRNRSRAVTKPGLMADHSSQQSPNQSYARTIPSSLFGSPKFIRDFTTKYCLSYLIGTTTESLRSPTSILDTPRAVSPFAFGNPFSPQHDNNNNNKSSTLTVHQKVSSENTRSSSWDKLDSSKGIGLALVGALNNDDDDEAIHEYCDQPNKGNVLFGTKLKVKIPPLLPPPQQTCAGDVVVGGATTTKDSQNSGIYAKDSPNVVVTGGVGVLSLSEMELSEDYTRVISHGPNPRTTHIFNNCIVESYFSLPKTTPHSSSSSGNFLSFCFTCKKHLDQTKDIFIYRGEKAFCSPECRHREMVLDGVENLEFC